MANGSLKSQPVFVLQDSIASLSIKLTKLIDWRVRVPIEAVSNQIPFAPTF